jgi:hypothetical protein
MVKLLGPDFNKLLDRFNEPRLHPAECEILVAIRASEVAAFGGKKSEFERPIRKGV